MNFEEVKQIVYESINKANTIENLIQIVVDGIYAKGKSDAYAEIESLIENNDDLREAFQTIIHQNRKQ